MKMGRRSSCQDVNRKNKSPFNRCVMAQNSFTAGDEFFNLEGKDCLKFPPLCYEDAVLQGSGFDLQVCMHVCLSLVVAAPNFCRITPD